MDYSFYDYNGTAFLFGKIYDGETPGYSQIKYAEIVIDDKYHYLAIAGSLTIIYLPE